MNPLSKNGVAVGLGLLVALLAINAGLAYRNTRQLHEDATRVAHTHEVLDALDDLLSTVKDAETGQRGFLVTGESQYLEPYDDARDAADDKVERVRRLTEDNPRQQARIPSLRELIRAKLDELARTVALRQKAGFDAARAVVLTDEGKQEMDSLRALVGEMRQEERALLQERQEANARAYVVAVSSGLVATLLGLAAVGACAGLLRRHLTARAKAAAAIHEQRELLHATLTSIGDGLIATDAEGRVTLLNPVARALTGWAPEEACGKPLGAVFHIVNEETREPVDNPARRALQDGRVVGLANHTVLIAKDGKEWPIDDCAAPIRARGGAVRGAVLIFRDISERKQAQQALRDSEERFRGAFEHTNVAMVLTDLDHRFVRANAAFARFFGYSDSAILQMSMADVTHPDDLAESYARRKALQAGEVAYFQMEKRYLHKDGHVRWGLANVSLVRDGRGRPLHYVGQVQDITERKRAEEEVREQRQWLQVTLASIGDAVIATDTGGRVMFMNPVAETLTGWRQDDAAGKPLADVFPIVNEVSREPVESPVSRVLREGTVQGLANHTVLTAKDGTERPIDDSAAPIRDHAGQTHGVVLVFHDVSERRGLERELRERVEGLAEADRRKDEFLAMLAHELRNPLAPMRNALHVLRHRGAEAGTVGQVRELLERQVQHMARLVDDLLDVSRITRGRITLRPERVDLARLVRLHADDQRDALVLAGLSAHVDLPETPVWVTGDPTRLRQVLDNLLGNAMKFTERGGLITIRLATQDDDPRAVLSVGDTGIGIDAQMLPRLFDVFAQADTSLDRSRGGLGLGLALVKGLVELHGGTVRATSAGQGRGAEFTVSLPRERELPALTEAPVPPAAPRQRLRILVVEDNRDAAESLRMLLELFGYEVTVAYTGPDGVAAAQRARPDVVLCDIGLPGMDGFAVADALRQDPATAGARLIAVTGYGQDEDRRRALAAGFDEHLVKPVDPEVLLDQLVTSSG